MLLKVYYLDDEPDLCENFTDEFSSSEIDVTTFTDPGKAIQAIKTFPPDLLFIDYRLPGITADDVAEALDPKIPKILITGDLEVSTRTQFLRKFSKPLPWEEIQTLLIEYKNKVTA